MRAICLLLLALPLCAQQMEFMATMGVAGHNGFSQTATVVVPGATGGTQPNFTVVVSFSDTKMKVVGSGGLIQNLCARVVGGVTFNVPCDLIVTDDATCTAITGGYTWDFESYSSTAGTGFLWIMNPSFTTGGFTPTICIGKLSVSTYQGGAIGSSYDSNTVGRWHMPNGSSLTVADFSANNITTTNTNGTAVAGKIDGGVNGIANATVSAANNTGFNSINFTTQGWFKTSSATNGTITWRDDGVGRSFIMLVQAAGSVAITAIFGTNPSVTSSATTYADGNWHLATGTISALAGTTTVTLYVDGVSQGTATTAATNPTINTPLQMMNNVTFGNALTGSIDEVVFASVTRSANWVASEYGNQNNPPAIGAFTP